LLIADCRMRIVEIICPGPPIRNPHSAISN
jgi:hypothetical protein